MSLPMASVWAAAQPPALPRVAKASKGWPVSSSLRATNRSPQPVRTDDVVPETILGRARRLAVAPRLAHGFFFAFGIRGRQHLHRAAAVAIDGHAFAAELEGEPIADLDVLWGGGIREVDGLRNGVLGMALEGRLHPD